jgi:hypothetical protein
MQLHHSCIQQLIHLSSSQEGDMLMEESWEIHCSLANGHFGAYQVASQSNSNLLQGQNKLQHIVDMLLQV